MKILINECCQEISSFNPVPGRYEDFRIAFGGAVFSYYRQTRTEIAGALNIFEECPGIVLTAGYSARAITSGGPLGAVAFQRIAAEFLDSVRGVRDVDGVYFSMHGALAAETETDVEGFLLQETRKIIGEKIPIVVSLDLHGILTDRILQHSNAVVVYHTYPHIDLFQTGQRAARVLLRILAGEVRPVTARVPIPALVRGDELITETGLFGRCIRQAQALECGSGGVSAGMFIGNPFTDVPELCSNAFVVTDGDVQRSEKEAVSLALEFWEMRQRLHTNLTSLEESIRLAAETKGRVVLSDAADATSSGASGDSNAILRAMMESGFRKTVLAPIVDAPAVDAAMKAGTGWTIDVSVGGTLDSSRFKPLTIRAHVSLLSEGRFRSESYDEMWDSGPTAVLKVGVYTLVVTSRPVSLYDRSLFLAHGQNPAFFDVVIGKSPHFQRQFFDGGVERLINVDVPGATSANLKSLGHKHCLRPMYPLDKSVEFQPKARIFQRRCS